jgi:hypothetical protein
LNINNGKIDLTPTSATPFGQVVYINYFLSHSSFGIPDWSIMPFNVLGLIVFDP